jgi:hypothetical protein
MLEAQRFLIQRKREFLDSRYCFDISNGETAEVVGTIDEQLSGSDRLFRWFVSNRFGSQNFEARERTDQALVFTIHRGWYLFSAKVEIHDAMGAYVGSVKKHWRGRFHLADQYDRQVAVILGNPHLFEFKVFTADRRVEMAKIIPSKPQGYTVEMSEDLQGQPLTKMLILSAAISLEVVWQYGKGTKGVKK